MLTGRYPEKALAPSYLNYPDNLFTLLRNDYDIQASESVAQLCPPAVCGGTTVDRETGLVSVLRESASLARELVSPFKSNADPAGSQFVEKEHEHDEEDDTKPKSVKFRWKELGANQPEPFTEFLDSLRPTERPTVHFLHILLPHIPFRYLPSGATYPRAARRFTFAKALPGGAPSGAELSFRQRHLLQLAYTDKLIGEVVKTLERQGLYDDALIIMTADHGANFTAGTPLRTLVPENAHELAYVPTFVKLPGQNSGKIDDRNWEHVDLLPTIADALDYDVPWKVDGFTGLGPDRRTRPEKYWYDKAGQRKTFSATQARPKLMRGMVELMASPEHGAAGLFQFGPRRDMVRKTLTKFDVGPASQATAVLNLAPEVKADAETGRVPSMVWGSVSGVPVGTPVAVAVNGTIGAVGLVFPDYESGDPHLAAMVSDALYRNGSNSLELFVVEQVGDATRLRPISFRKA